MNLYSPPDQTLSRRQRRLRSGVRNLLLCALAVLLLSLIYTLSYFLSKRVLILHRSRAIGKALQESNIPQAAKLLNDFQQTFPGISDQQQLLRWQYQLTLLQKREQARQLKFQSLLTSLQQRAARNALILPVDLANAAQYAAAPDDLALLYDLQDHAVAQARQQALKKARSNVEKLQSIRRILQKMAVLRRDGNLDLHRKLQHECRNLLEQQLQGSQILPESIRELQALQQQFNQEVALVQATDEKHRQEETDFQYVLQGVYPEEITSRAGTFLQKYPLKKYTTAIRQLQSDLAFVQKEFQNDVRQKLEQLNRRSNQLQKVLKNALADITAEFMTGKRFELVLQVTTSTTRREHDRIIRFETYENCAFSAPDTQGFRHIRFKDISNNIISGRFRSDGSGELITSGGRQICRLRMIQPEGYLPEAYYQTVISEMNVIIATHAPSESILLCDALLQQTRDRLPPLPAERLRQALQEADQKLGGAEQFAFEHKFWTEALAWVPVFAGLLYVAPDGQSHFLAGGSPPSAGTALWRIENHRFFPGGTAQVPLRPESPSPPVYVMAMPANQQNPKDFLRKHQLEAAQKRLHLPELPDYLQAVFSNAQ